MDKKNFTAQDYIDNIKNYEAKKLLDDVCGLVTEDDTDSRKIFNAAYNELLYRLEKKKV